MIQIISLGKLSRNFATIAADYEKMIKWKTKFIEITYNRKLPETQIKHFEAKLIKEHLQSKSYKIALNVIGKNFDSWQFSDIFSRNRNIDFIIGGAFGLDQVILDLSDMHLSLSTMTLPHQVAKIILLEQIYRSQTMIENHPYHK